MSIEEGICTYCKDVILNLQDVVLIQKGYINNSKQFIQIGPSEVRHERCHKLIEARAIVMADISVQLAIPDCSKRIEGIIFKKENLL